MADTLITGTTLVEKESRSIGDTPIGGIVAWAKTLSGVPNLAEGWVECDGATLVDALSPLNGQTIPDLNGGEFLEGRATSGATGGSATMAHTHVTDLSNATGFVLDDSGGGTANVHNLCTSNDNATGNITSGAASNTENRPPFYTVVWIMRVR